LTSPAFWTPVSTQTLTGSPSWSATRTISDGEILKVTEAEALADLFFAGSGGGELEIVADSCGIERRGSKDSCRLATIPAAYNFAFFAIILGSGTLKTPKFDVVIVVIPSKPTSSSTTGSSSSSKSTITTSSTAIPTPYIITPNPGASQKQLTEFTVFLNTIAEPGSVSTVNWGTVAFWRASLTFGQPTLIKKMPVVSSACHCYLINKSALFVVLVAYRIFTIV
jgi:hypothetical protein